MRRTGVARAATATTSNRVRRVVTGSEEIFAGVPSGGACDFAVEDASATGAVPIVPMGKQGSATEYAINVTINSPFNRLPIPPSHETIIRSLAAGGHEVRHDSMPFGTVSMRNPARPVMPCGATRGSRWRPC